MPIHAMAISARYQLRFALYRAAAWARLVRLGNLGILAAAVLLGGLLAGGLPALAGEDGLRLLIAAVSAVAVAAGGNALNDVHDVGIDAVNQPDRPLPSGNVSRGAARAVWALGSAVGVLLGLTVSFLHAVIAAGCVLALMAYSARLKRTPLVGNLVVSALVAVALVYGALLFMPTPAVWAGVGFAFGTTLARELAKDVADVPGDVRAGLRTAPIVWGERAAVITAVVVLLVTVLTTPIPYLYLGYGGIYLLGVLVTDAILLRAVWILLVSDEGAAARASGITKWGMVTGILALALYWTG